MSGFFDCYVLAPERTATAVLGFLGHFIPRFEPSFHPDDPAEVLGLPLETTVEQALEFLESNSSLDYSMYFRNTDDNDPFHAAAIFNEDGSLILMLSVQASDSEITAKKWLSKLQKFAGARSAYWGLEEPPVLNELDFLKRADLGPS